MKFVLYSFGVEIFLVKKSDTNDQNELIDSVVDFRDDVRNTVVAIPNKKKLSNKTKEELIELALSVKTSCLNSTDSIRKTLVASHDIKIEDKGSKNQKSIWKMI